MHRIVEQTASHAISSALRRCDGNCSGRELLVFYAWAAATAAVFYGRRRDVDAEENLDFLKDEEVFAFELLCKLDATVTRRSIAEFDAVYWDLIGRVLECVDEIFDNYSVSQDIAEANGTPVKDFFDNCYQDFVPLSEARMPQDLASFFVLLVNGETIRASQQALVDGL